jgi:cytochrome c-type biogenesis protein CcmH
MSLRRRFCAMALLAAAGTQALASPAPEKALADPALEARAQSLAREIRCVVCENEPVALSSAEIAVDMRAAIRTRIAAGDSDAQVRRFFADRYGEFVLLRPRWGGETIVLWTAPFALIVLGGLALVIAVRRARQVPPAEPDINDQAAREALAALETKTGSD